MATFRITSQNFQQTEGGPRFNGDSAQARRELVRIAAGLRTANGRGVIQGYLRLTDGADNRLTLGKNLLWSRSRANLAAKDLVADMVAKAYGDHLGVQQALTDYLAQSDQRVGTQSFVKLVQALDGLDDVAQADQKDASIQADRLALRLMQPAQTARLRTNGIAPLRQEASSCLAPNPPEQSDSAVTQVLQQAHARAPQKLIEAPPEPLLNGDPKPSQSEPAKPQYLSVIRHAIDADGIRREIQFGEAPADGDCALHTAALALKLPINRQAVCDWVTADFSKGDPDTVDQIASFIAADLKTGNPAEYRGVTAALIKTSPGTYLNSWTNLFSDRERIWGSLQHLQYILRRHNRPLNMFVVDMLNPTQIKLVEQHDKECLGEAVNVVNLNTNTGQAALNFNARMTDLETGLDYQTVIELIRQSPEDQLAALRSNQQFTRYAKSQADAGDSQSDDSWPRVPQQDDEPSEDPDLPAKLTLAFKEISDSLEVESYQGNHWDLVTLL